MSKKQDVNTTLVGLPPARVPNAINSQKLQANHMIASNAPPPAVPVRDDDVQRWLDDGGLVVPTD